MSLPQGAQASCLSCLHFERMFRACKFDALRAKGPRVAPRILPQTDIRAHRCADFHSWETGLLPFSATPDSRSGVRESADAGG